MRLRRLHRWWAWVARYFWLPCPLCSQEFGGHEWRDIDGKSSTIYPDGREGNGRGICPDCTVAGTGPVDLGGTGLEADRMSERQERYERWLADCASVLEGVLGPVELDPRRQSFAEIEDVVNGLRAELDRKPSEQE